MRALVLTTLLLACSSQHDENPPQPTTPCGQSIALIGGAIHATLVRPDAEAFRRSAELAPERSCAGVAELVSDWEAYLKAPAPERKRELLTRLEDLAAHHRWTPSASLRSAIAAAKAE